MEVFPGKILIVDDEPDIVEFISYNLKNKGYLIATAGDGVEAIRKAKEFRPDLILMDIMMPNKDGMATVKELRVLPEFEDTAIIFLTALNDEKYEIEGLKIGADDFISKPIKPELLATRIGATLRRLRSTRPNFLYFIKAKRYCWRKRNLSYCRYLLQSPGVCFSGTRYCSVFGVPR